MSFVCHLRMLAYWYVSTNKNYCLIYNITISYTFYDWVRMHVFCTPSRGAGAANCTVRYFLSERPFSRITMMPFTDVSPLLHGDE